MWQKVEIQARVGLDRSHLAIRSVASTRTERDLDLPRAKKIDASSLDLFHPEVMVDEDAKVNLHRLTIRTDVDEKLDLDLHRPTARPDVDARMIPHPSPQATKAFERMCPARANRDHRL